MKTNIYKPAQKEEIANAIDNVTNVAFKVDYEEQGYRVRCFYDRKDDTIAVACEGYLNADWHANTAEGRLDIFNDLTFTFIS